MLSWPFWIGGLVALIVGAIANVFVARRVRCALERRRWERDRVATATANGGLAVVFLLVTSLVVFFLFPVVLVVYDHLGVTWLAGTVVLWSISVGWLMQTRVPGQPAITLRGSVLEWSIGGTVIGRQEVDPSQVSVEARPGLPYANTLCVRFPRGTLVVVSSDAVGDSHTWPHLGMELDDAEWERANWRLYTDVGAVALMEQVRQQLET